MASDYQTDDDAALNAAQDQEDALAQAIDTAFTDYRDTVDADAMRNALAAGGTAAAIAAALLGGLDKEMKPATDALASVFRAAAQAEARAMAQMVAARAASERAARIVTTELPGTARLTVPSGQIIHLPYDPSATAGLTDLEMQRANLLANLRNATEDGINAAVQAAYKAHLDIDQIAAVLRDTIGLTPRQAQAILNFREALESGSASLDQALAGNAWVLRDPKFDATLERIADGEFVADSKIDAMVEAYARRQLSYRARTIARTQAMISANAGVRSNYTAAIGRGVFPSSAVRRFWQISLTEGTCKLCLSIPPLNPKGVGFDEPFASIEGPIMVPVEDTHANCQCSLRYEVAQAALTNFASVAAE